ncbi:hypothetical protein ScPMuIL_010446 [Solemya velum]
MPSSGRVTYNSDDEIEPLLKGTADGVERKSSVAVPVPSTEPPATYRSRWRSIRIMYLTMFLSSVSFSICMSSLWPYLKVLHPDSTANSLGWVVAAYSLGQLVASPLFGKWANWRKRNREPLIFSITINILANILYAYLESIPSDRQYYLLVARVFVGFGAGNVAVVRSYMSAATTMTERTGAMANMSAFQAIGFIIGPGIQAALAPIGYPGPINTTAFHFNMYTSPAFLSAAVGVVNIVLLIVVFEDYRVYDDGDVTFSISNSINEERIIPDYKPNLTAVLASVFLFFSALFIFAVFETIGTPLTMHMYAWSRQQATMNNGIILAVGGIISIFVFMIIKLLSKRVNERYLLLGGFLFCFAGFFVFLPWGNEYPPYENARMLKQVNVYMSECNFSISPSGPNITAHPYVSPMLSINTTSSVTTVTTTTGGSTTTVEPRGCPDAYVWCSTVPVVRFSQFLVGTFLITIGYPTCNVMSYSIYSKILGPKPQGTMMGLLTAAGSLARTVGPIYVSEMYDTFGPRVTFSSVSGLIVFTVIVMIFIFKKLVPFTFKNTSTSSNRNNKRKG